MTDQGRTYDEIEHGPPCEYEHPDLPRRVGKQEVMEAWGRYGTHLREAEVLGRYLAELGVDPGSL